MELAQFGPVAKRLYESGAMDIRLEEDTEFSLPVAVRRSDAQYDAVFLYQRPPAEGDSATPRPFAWALFEADTGDVALLARCDLVDFVPAGRYPPDHAMTLALPKALTQKKLQSLMEKLLEAYGDIRTFAFEESLTRQQAAAVSSYKDLFQKLSYPAHYPFYHALSPAFFHWLRLPLPGGAAESAGQAATELQKDGYQLLILENLQQLVRQFQDKIAVDDHKERLFDELHRELQDYKNDLLGALTQSLERDIIQVIDDVCKSVEACREKEPTAENYRHLLELFAGVETDLCDLLYRHGVEPYTVDAVDVTRQKILSTVRTDRPELDKTIAASHARGWEKDGKTIRPERISVYVYSTDSADTGKGESIVHE